MSDWSKSKYEGEYKDGWYHGQGEFRYPNGVIYKGGFFKGEFHGEGTLIYPNGGKYKAKWERGKMLEGDYFFEDDLKYEFDDWDYCTEDQDRRFYYERQSGFDPKKYDSKLKPIPEGTYDVGDGYYDPIASIVYDYEGQVIRTPSEKEVEWITTKCRYNPRTKLGEITGEDDRVIKKAIEVSRPPEPELKQPAQKQEAEKTFDEYMAMITIKEEDYFRPDPNASRKTTTIMNNMIVALKRCHEIVKEMEAQGKKLFDDPDFGPQGPNDHAESSLYIGDTPYDYPDPDHIQWLRPSEIVTDRKTVFMDQEVDTNDVIQGRLGDCWLISGFSVLATQPEYIRGGGRSGFDSNPELVKQLKEKELTDEEAEQMQKGLWCPVFHHLRKYGIYVIRFFKNYSWRYVIIDDKLPCMKEEDTTKSSLVFGRCRNQHEFWVPLLEKAYAKLHHCYEAIVSGYIDDALTDMTGLVSNKLKIQGPNGFPSPQVGSAEELWQKLMFYRASYTMMGCSIQGQPGEREQELRIYGEPVGLLKSHAYSILDILEIPNPNAKNKHKSHRLLRIRNPWGTKEWNGDWSDGSAKLLANLSKLNAYIDEKARKGKIEQFDPEADDGTFLISFNRWRNIYHNLFCCVDFPDEWSGLRFYDQWTTDNSGGTPMRPNAQNIKDWAKNPQFVVNINNQKKKTTKLLISLGQNDGRLLRGLVFPFKDNINQAVISVFQLKAGEEKLEMFDTSRVKKLSAVKEYRENSIEVELENGSYVIVPSTGEAGKVGPFVLNVYFECEKSDISITKAGSDLKGELIQEEEETILHYDKDLKKILKLELLALLCDESRPASKK